MAEEYTGEVITAQPYSGSVHQPPAQDEPTFWKEMGRQIGLTARAGVQGVANVAALPGTAIDALTGGLDSSFGTHIPKFRSSQAVSDLLTRIGLPEPRNATERVAQDVAGGMAGGAGMMGLGNVLSKIPAAVDLGSSLAANAGAQTLANAGGSGAAGVTRESGGGPLAQTVAGMAGGVLPSAAVTAGEEAIRRGLRGGEAGRQNFSKNVDLFEKGIGVTPTVGQATDNLMTEGLESGLSRFPGGNVPIVAKAKAEEAALGAKVENLASSIAPPGTKMSVGKRIEEGITGPGGYMEQVKAQTSALYDKLDSLFGSPDYPVPVTNTTAFLDRLSAGQPGAENILKTLQNAKVIDIRQALNKDLGGKPGTNITLLDSEGKPLSTVTQGGTPAGTTMPLDAWKQVRSRIGELLGDPQLTSDIPRRQLKGLYASMSRDIEAAASQRDAQLVSSGAVPQGSAPVMQAVNRANTVTRLIHDRIDEVLQPVVNAGGPENLYNAAVAGTKDGNTKLHAVMRALPQEGRDALVADIFRRMGKATGSGQSAQGNAFSTERFLTQWSNLSPEAKRTITIGQTPQFNKDLDTIVNITGHLREGSSVFKNPSGSGQAIVAAGAAGSLATGVLLSPLTGPAPLIAAGGTIGATYGAARLLTSPTFVHWLAQSTRVPTEQLPAQLNILSQIAAKEPHEDVKAAMASYIQSVKSNAPQTTPPQTASEYRAKFNAEPPTIGTKEDFEKLPAGEGYIDPRDGHYYIKG